MSTRRPAIPFSLIDPAEHPDPDRCDAWRRLRAEQPVVWCETGKDTPGFWVVTRYQDIAASYRDTARLSSRQGNVLSTLLSGGDTAGGRMLADGHLRVAVPAGDRARMLELTMAAMGSDGSPQSPAAAGDAQRDILMYYAGLLPQRRRSPGADIVSLMATQPVDGKPLSDAEVLLNCYNIIIGGDETTRLSSVGGALALMEHPQAWQLLRRDESVLDSAVEEVLRWTTPATHIGRTATSDLTLHGCEIAAGDIVTLWNISANRDEDVFHEPYRFDLLRAPNKHLTLGHGAHFCLGGPLARIELRVLLQELRTQIAHMEPAGPVERIRSSFLTGVSRLPTRVKR